MAAPRTSLFIMARNAEATLRACLESAAPYVDEIVVALAGESTDRTVEILNEFTIENSPPKRDDGPAIKVKIVPWKDDFAWARNEGWQHLTGDYALWLDADDILDGGENMRRWVTQNPQANVFFAPYHYEQDQWGNLSTTLWRERLVRNPQDWKWEGAIHEVLICDPSVSLSPVTMEDVVIRHNPERNRDKGTRNLDILYRELARTEPSPSQRLLYYLGRENAVRGNLKEAMLHLNRYISQATGDDESYQMAHLMVELLRESKRYPEAKKAALKAIEMKPDWPDAYFSLARIAYENGNFQECIEWTRAGETKEPPRTSVIIDPRAYTYWPLYFLGLSYLGLGDWEMASANLQRAATIVPDEQILGLIATAQERAGAQKALDAVFDLHEYLGRHDEWLKARQLWGVVPKVLERHPQVVQRMLDTYRSTEHVEDPQVMIDFYRNNPGWAPMADEHVLSPEWAQHPRLVFARKSVTCDPPATILDLGSSDGFISLPLAKDGHIIEGFDLDPRCVDIANRRAQEWGLRASYKVGGVEDVEGKYDVALAFEIIEHLADPDAFLDQLDEKARKVVITTPHLAWERGYVADWQKVEPKGHLRIFDLDDLEARLSHRGRVFDLYVEPYGQTGWIFASYRPRQSYKGTVTFLAPGTVEEWSPRKLRREGLGGSETALVRLAEELFYADGQDTESRLCTVYGRIDAPGYYNGVRYRGMESFDPGTSSDVLVAWRYPEAADLAVRADRMVLWMHDTDAGDRLTPVRAARFDRIVVLSEWHKAHMLRTYPFLEDMAEKLVVIGNGVDLERFAPAPYPGGARGVKAPKREPHRVAYTSSPDRGLDVVLEHIWPKVVEAVPDAELHVYYGWNNWTPAMQAAYPHLGAFRQKVANLLLDSKNVIQHGRIPQDELAIELQKSSVWLYPAWSSPVNGPFYETYCISAVEAQAAGSIPITADTGALSETVGSGVIVQGTMDGSVPEDFASAVIEVLTLEKKQVEKLRAAVVKHVPAVSWTEIAQRWTRLLD